MLVEVDRERIFRGEMKELQATTELVKKSKDNPNRSRPERWTRCTSLDPTTENRFGERLDRFIQQSLVDWGGVDAAQRYNGKIRQTVLAWSGGSQKTKNQIKLE